MNENIKSVKIEMQFANNPAVVIFLLFEFFIFVYVLTTTDILLSYPSTSLILILFGVFGLTALIGWLVFRVKVMLDFELGKPRITSKGLISKTVITWPFQFYMGKQLTRINMRFSRISDYLMIYDETKSITLSVKSIDTEKTDEFDSIKRSTFMDTYTAIGASKRLVWETYWMLSSYKNNSDTDFKFPEKNIDSTYDMMKKLKQTKKREFNPFEE